jgi:hypothetical protein
MKRVKYISILTLIFGAMTFSCDEDFVRPLTGDEDEDPIIIPPPPPPPTQNSTGIDSLNLGN